MEVYKVPDVKEMAVLKPYIKLFEDVNISKEVSLGDNLYKEVIFKKKGFGRSEEYLYLDENNNIVEDKNLRARIGRLTFFMDSFLNDDKGSIIKALQGEDDIEKNKDDFKLMEEGLKLIGNKSSKYDIGKGEIEKIQGILVKLMDLRGKTNEKLKGFLQKVEEEMSKKEYFDEEVIENCMPYYKEVMTCNYEKVQLIAKGNIIYGNIKSAAEKLRRSYNIRFITNHTEELMKVSYMMGYFDSLLRAYGNIVNMSYNDYVKGIANSGKNNAEYKLTVIREK